MEIGLDFERAVLHGKRSAQEDRLEPCNHVDRAAWDPMEAKHQKLSMDLATGRGRRTSPGLP